MSVHERELLHPEDASSLEEFQARRIAEQLQIRAMNSSWKSIGLILLSSLLCVAAFLFWGSMAVTHDGARWFFLVVAIGFTLAFLRVFGRIELRGVRGSARYMQLTRLSKEWQARARRGERPAAGPGRPKVWRDEVSEAKTQ